MKQEPLVVERVYDASPQRIWDALTKLEKIKKWYFQMDNFKPEIGFEFRFEGDKDGVIFHHLCKITALVPGKKIAYSWRYEGYPGNSEVTIELFPERSKTRLRLTHTGLESFQPGLDFARENFENGWAHILGNSLKEFLEKDLVA
jgi:uncharacterized protein YndB with AHSA1/START domain